MSLSRRIQTVTVAGATGTIGPYVVDALLHAGLAVTVLSRSSAKKLPAGVQTRTVDYDSSDSLAKAFVDQDAVIDLASASDSSLAVRLIKAAASSGVYRFITAEFGLDPGHPPVQQLPVFHHKKMAYDAVQAQAEASSLTYSMVACGEFIELALKTGCAGIDLQQKKAVLYDNGDNVVPWSSMKDIGHATAQVLLHPAETHNRSVFIHSVNMSQRQMLEAAQDVVGSEDWDVTHQDAKALYDQALADIAAGTATMMSYNAQIRYGLAKKEIASPWLRDDNELLGVKEMSSEELKSIIKACAT